MSAPAFTTSGAVSGVTPETAPLVVKAGADTLVAGSAVFKGGPSAYAGNIEAIRKAAEAARGEWV